MSDELKIKNVLTRYCRAIDDRDWDLLKSVVDENLEFTFPTGKLCKGAKDLVAEFNRLGLWPAGRHVVCNTDLTIDGDSASAVSDWFWLDPWLRPSRAGRYLDSYRRSGDTWLLCARRQELFTPHVEG